MDPVRNSAGLAQALTGQGVPAALEMLDRVNHVTLIGAMAAPLRRLAPVLDRVAGFVSDASATRP